MKHLNRKDDFYSWVGNCQHETGNYGEMDKNGEGVTRPVPGEQTSLFTLIIRLPRRKPMRWYTKAPSLNEAVKYAKNRWPKAVVSLESK